MIRRPGFRDFGADRDDPTGMRSLLSSLPDPAPMPDDVAVRIRSSLDEAAGELRRRGVQTEPAQPPWATPRARAGRASRPAIAALAAGFLVVAGAGVFGLQSLQAGSSDAPPMVVTPHPTQRTATPSTPSGSSSSVVGQRSVTPPPRFTVSKTAYTRRNLVQRASAVWAAAGSQHPSFNLHSLAAEQPGIGPLATPMGLADCLAALGIDAPGGVVADFALYEQRPAAVLMTSSGQTVRVVVVDRACRSGQPSVIAEPVTLPGTAG